MQNRDIVNAEGKQKRKNQLSENVKVDNSPQYEKLIYTVW